MDWLSLPNSTSPWITAAGWAIVHSLWQLTVIAAIYGGVRFFVKRYLGKSSSPWLYGAGCVALLTVCITPIATFCIALIHLENGTTLTGSENIPIHSTADDREPNFQLEKANLIGQLPPSIAADPTRSPDAIADSRKSAQGAFTKRPLPMFWIVLGWSLGVCIFAFRPLLGMLHVQRLIRSSQVATSPAWKKVAQGLIEKMGISQVVQFAESTCVQVPTVVGYLKPLVLLPASAVTGLNQQQLQLILAHELAHIRRHDYLMNFAQTIIETVLFYHPATWWLSSQIRIERENCCDDVAVKFCGDPSSLAHALLALEESRTIAPALAANGGVLISRVRRLLEIPPTKTVTILSFNAMMLTGVLSMIAMSVAFGSSTRPQESEPNLDNRIGHWGDTLARSPGTILRNSIDNQAGNTAPNSGFIRHNQENSKSNGVATEQASKTAPSNYIDPVLDALVIERVLTEECQKLEISISQSDIENHIRSLADKVNMATESYIAKFGCGKTQIECMSWRDIALRRILEQQDEVAASKLEAGKVSDVIQVGERWAVMHRLALPQAPLPQDENDERIVVYTYAVADLVVSPYPFTTNLSDDTEERVNANPILDLIKKTIEPESWAEHSIVFYEDHLSFVVSHRQNVHEQLQHLLANLRQLNDVTIENRAFLVVASKKDFMHLPEQVEKEPTKISLRVAATLNSLARAKESVLLQEFPTTTLHNGQRKKLNIAIPSIAKKTTISMMQTVTQDRASLRTVVFDGGENAQQGTGRDLTSKSGQFMVVDLSEMMQLDSNEQRAIFIFKSHVIQDVE